MTEFQIFKTILKNGTDKQFDFPKLQKDSVEVIADTFSNIIYETLKQKSSTSVAKRGNVLKFINKLCAVKPPHIEKSAAEPYLQVAKNFYLSTNCEDIQSFQNEIKNELEKTCDLKENIQRFFKRRNDIQSNIGSRLESIKQLDQENLKLKYQLQPRKGIPHFEVTEAVIQKITENLCDSRRNTKSSSPFNSEILDFREKQVKLGYAWINLNEDKAVIEKILLKLAKYERLESFEENFVFTIWGLDEFSHYMNIISEHFFFIIERIIIEQSSKIVTMSHKDAEKYLADAQDGENFTKIRMVCSEIPFIRHKLHSLINELYILGFCNENLWKLHSFI